MIITEIQVLRRVHHPNIIRFIEIFESPTHISIVTELAIGMTCLYCLFVAQKANSIYLGGELFEQIHEKGSFKERDATKLIHQILGALSYLHDMGKFLMKLSLEV